MGSVIKMYANATGGAENALAQIDVPMGGRLIGVQWAYAAELDADGDDGQAQLSFRSAGAFTTNDDRGVISEIRTEAQLVTSGISNAFVNTYVPLPDIPVGPGERLYLHGNHAASTPAYIGCLLHFDFDIDKVASRRR